MDIIKTERLELRPLELDHGPLLLPIWSDEEVVKTTYIHDIYTEKDCQVRIERIINFGLSRKEYVIFEGNNLVGIVGISRDSSFEYGLYYLIGKEYWGRGYATEAAKAIVDAVFKMPEVVRVSADALTTNPASSRVLGKVGMKFEGCLRMKFHRNGVYGDLDTYSILRREYNS